MNAVYQGTIHCSRGLVGLLICVLCVCDMSFLFFFMSSLFIIYHNAVCNSQQLRRGCPLVV